MEKPPAYLLYFLLRIRKHSDERGYLVERFKDMELDRMAREAHMLRELHRLGFVALPDETEEKVYNPLREEVAPGVIVHKAGTEIRVPYAPTFSLLPAGHYVLRELAFEAVGKGIGTVLTALVGIVIGLLIAG